MKNVFDLSMSVKELLNIWPNLDKKIVVCVDEKDRLVGIIGLKEYIYAKELEPTMFIGDVMNRNCLFSYYDDESTIRRIFEEKNVFYLPLVDHEMKLVEIMDRRIFNADYNMFISYSQYGEDIIIDWIFKKMNKSELFYVDIGAFDPCIHSVTKALYDRGAKGINVEPQARMCERLKRERNRDITVCCAAGNRKGEEYIYFSEGNTTLCEEHKMGTRVGKVKCDTLTNILDKNIDVSQTIHILKIDVEGYEKNVIEGIDFSRYKPWIIVVEAVYSDDFESLLLENGYIFMQQYDINRYYLLAEKDIFIDRFVGKEEILKNYCVGYVRW